MRRVPDERQATLTHETQPEDDFERLVCETRHNHEAVVADDSRHQQQHANDRNFEAESDTGSNPAARRGGVLARGSEGCGSDCRPP